MVVVGQDARGVEAEGLGEIACSMRMPVDSAQEIQSNRKACGVFLVVLFPESRSILP